jgi:hypothetical protein
MIIGIMFLIQKRPDIAAMLSAIFLASAVMAAIILNAGIIRSRYTELFVFNPDPTDILLHVVYIILLVIIIFLFKEHKRRHH